jgi:hypothetical protein
MSKVWGRFFEILCASQKVRTLLKSLLWNCFRVGSLYGTIWICKKAPQILICLPYLICDLKMAFNPIVCSIYQNSATKETKCSQASARRSKIYFFAFMILIRHQLLTWNWTITTHTNDFFELNLHFLSLQICRTASADLQKLSCGTIKIT